MHFEKRESVVFEVNGQKIFGVIHHPNGEGPAPAVLICHGFAGHKVGYRRLYVQMAESLSKAGIATLRVDFRGCGDSEGCFGDVTIDQLVGDAQAALEFLGEQEEIDETRLGLLGVSLGGPVSVLAAQDATLQSLALWAPVANGVKWTEDWSEHYPGEVVEHHIRCGGQLASPEFRDQFLQIRARQEVPYLANLPLLHVHGLADRVVFPGHADIYREARGDAEAESCFVTLPNSDHNFSHHDGERTQLVEETMEWFRKTL